MISLDSFVDPFRTSFWLNDKHWFVAGVYVVMKNPEIWLYTLPICVYDRMTIPMYEISSVDNDGHLIIDSRHAYYVSQENKVRFKLYFVRDCVRSHCYSFIEN